MLRPDGDETWSRPPSCTVDESDCPIIDFATRLFQPENSLFRSTPITMSPIVEKNLY